MKRLLIGVGVGIVLVVAVTFFVCRDAGDGRIIKHPPARAEYPAEDFRPETVIEDRVTLKERLTPGHGLTFGERVLEDKPAGTEVYKVEGPAEIYRTPEGDVFVRQGGAGVEVWRKPQPLAELEFEPAAIAATNFKTVTVGVGVHVLRVWRVHAGPYAGAELPGPEFALGGDVAVDVYKNVEAAAVATYTPATGEKKINIGIGLAVR